MTAFPKYSDLEITNILVDETQFPKGINEHAYETQIKHTKLKWKINPYLFQSKLQRQFLDENSLKIISRIGYLNWIVVALIIVFSLLTNHQLFLLILLLYPFFKTSGLLDNGIILILMAAVLLLSFKFTNVYFIFGFIVFMLAYSISKLQLELFKKRIWKMAFADFKSFWKFYSNKLIYVDKTGLNNNYKDLFEKYPDLNI